MANLQGVLVSFFVAQMVWPMVYMAGSSAIAENFTLQFGFALIVLPSLLFTVFRLLPKNFKDRNGVLRQRNFLYYICCLCATTSTFSLMIALNVLGYLDGFIDFYLDNSEPYLGSPFGLADSLWDPTVRLVLYLTIIYKFDNGQDYTRFTLYWIGDMMQGMLTIILGAFAGRYAEGVNPAMAFNMLYFTLPVFALRHVLQVIQADLKPDGTSTSSTFKITDAVLIAGSVFSIILGFIKGLAALGSPLPIANYYRSEIEPYIMEPGKFGAVHCILCFAYLVPVQVICTYCLIKGSGGRMAEALSVLLAGAITRSSVCHVFSALSSQTLEKYRVVKNIEMVLFLNLFPVIISHLLMRKFNNGAAAIAVKKGGEKKA